jgi:hypothetical protein
MMRAAVLAAIVLLIAAVWLHPLFTSRSSRTIASQSPQPIPATQPTSWEHIHGKEGFWRIGKTSQGVWWFVSPQGKADFLNTVTTVQPFQIAKQDSGPHFVSRNYNGGTTEDGNLRAWAAETLARVQAAGFKGLGAWCNPIFHELNVPITRDLNLWAWLPEDHRKLYSPKWVEFVEKAAAQQCPPLKDNKNLVGYYLDNELDWGDGVSGPSQYFNHLAADDPNKQQVIAIIKKNWPTVEAFNTDWNQKIQNFDELNMWDTLPHNAPRAYVKLYGEWLEHLATDYFRLTTELVRKYDPNHLILGVRFKGYAPREVVRASKNYTDAQSLNYYVNDARLDAEMFKSMYDESDQPVIISEYSFHALDGRSGNRNTVGFSGQVMDQEARADGYRMMTQRLARVPYVVGADWFQWSDEPPSGRKMDGEDVNFGIVDVDDNEYDLMTRSVQATTPTLNVLHSGSGNDDEADIFREPFKNKSTTVVPYLTRAPRLNGELSDWPWDARLQDIRVAETIGLERSGIPLPNIYLGWREEGLYLAFEVFDSDIRGADPKGWWWTRDCVEFWLSTRAVPADQDIYDAYCHQFFFVPMDAYDQAGIAGVAGQWHRSGDALTDNLIPHPDIRQVARVLHDRYVVELFVPAKAMNGFDPKTNPQMAFNVHVKNFQHATDYFWSAPKEATTQLRPNTWGAIVLSNPPGPVAAK